MTYIRLLLLTSVLAFLASPALIAFGTEPEWQMQPVEGPGSRAAHAMAYDSGRGVTILFGGQDRNYQGDTWEWNGSAWSHEADSGPSPRSAPAMAYDSARGVTLLFGGSNHNDPVRFYGDTWEWDGSTWTQRSTAGPSARLGHAMAYDGSRNRTVLFGGSDGVRNGETWEWDGKAWTLRSIAGPSARAGHAMAYDSAREVIVLFGGADEVLSGETWEWDGDNWVQREVPSPSPRYRHTMAYDGARSVTVLFGGYDDGTYDDETWEWDGKAWIQQAATGPGKRSYPAMVYDSDRGETILFGGFDGEFSGETWKYGVLCDGTESFTKAVCRCPNKQKLVAKGTATAGQEVVIAGDNDLGSKTVTANGQNKWKAVFKDTVVCGTTYQPTATFECRLSTQKTRMCD